MPGTRLAQKPLPVSIHGLEVSRIASILNAHGYKASVLVGLKGGSGENHLFDFVGRKDGERLAIMGLDSKDYESAAIEMVKLRVKTMDSNPTYTIVVFQTKDPRIHAFAEEYGYMIIENDNLGTVYEKLSDVLRSL